MPHVPGSRMPDMSREVHGTHTAHPFMLLNRVGAGGYGAVYRARYLAEPRETGIFACKAMAKGPPGSILEQLHVREISHHRKVTHHPNIANFQGFFNQNPDYVYLFMQYYHTGSLFRIIAKTDLLGKNDALVKRLFLQMLSAVQYCHKKGIYHRDIKPENILVNDDCTEVYLTDFGLSTQSRHSKTFRVGSKHYMSPECINANAAASYDTKRGDIWALGVVLINMITGRCPWTEASPSDPNFMSYTRNHNWLRNQFPISKGADSILRRIFTSHSAKTIEIDELRVLIEELDTFYMSKEDISRGSNVLRKNSEYLVRRPQPIAPPPPPPSEGLPLWILPPGSSSSEWEGDVLASDTESESSDSGTNTDADWEDSVPGIRIRRIIPLITDPDLHDGQVGWGKDKTPAAHLEHPELLQPVAATEPPIPNAAALSSGQSPIPAIRVPALVLPRPARIFEEESSVDFSPNVPGRRRYRRRDGPDSSPSSSSSNAQDTASSESSHGRRRFHLRRRSSMRVRTLDHEIVDPLASHPWSRFTSRMRRLLGGRN